MAMVCNFVFQLSFLVLLYFSSTTGAEDTRAAHSTLEDLADLLLKLDIKGAGLDLLDPEYEIFITLYQ